MSTTYHPHQAILHDQAANEGVVAELSERAIGNLTGYFDVLIQMDLAQKQRNERTEEDGIDL